MVRERQKNLEEQKIQQYHLAPEGESVTLREGGPNFLLHPDCVLLRSSQRLNGLR